jgi:hypothetical protein
MICVYDTLTSGMVVVHVLLVRMQGLDCMVLGIDRNAYFFSHTFFPPENRSFYEVNMKNMVGPDRPHNMAQKSWGLPVG